jgi:hypothetical protein
MTLTGERAALERRYASLHAEQNAVKKELGVTTQDNERLKRDVAAVEAAQKMAAESARVTKEKDERRICT